MQLNAFISFRIFKELNEALPSEREAPYERMRFRTLSYGGSVTGVVGLDGFEPSTPALSRRCSNRLSYRPNPVQFIQPTDKRERRQYLRASSELSFVSLKEVIQPHLPVLLPCYDFTPVMKPTVDAVLLAVKQTSSGEPHSHGVTGGVYKTRERIHRGMLIRDY